MFLNNLKQILGANQVKITKTKDGMKKIRIGLKYSNNTSLFFVLSLDPFKTLCEKGQTRITKIKQIIKNTKYGLEEIYGQNAYYIYTDNFVNISCIRRAKIKQVKLKFTDLKNLKIQIKNKIQDKKINPSEYPNLKVLTKYQSKQKFTN